MIVIKNTGISTTLRGMATEILATPMNSLKGVIVNNESDFKIAAPTCCYDNLAIADVDSNDLEKNDSLSLFFDLPSISTSFALDLYNSSGLIAHITDNLYGQLYLIGNSIFTYQNQSTHCGFIADWKKILIAFGEERYYFVETIAGTTYNSLTYDLKQWSEQAVEGTVLIESYMNGFMLRSGINLKGVNARNCQRIPAFFGLKECELVVYQDLFTENNGNHREVIERKKIRVDSFWLYTKPMPECFADLLLNYQLFGNDIFITDNNMNNFSYNFIRVKIGSFEAEKPKYQPAERTVTYEIKLKEVIQDNQKTNFS